MKILQIVPYFYPAWSYGGPGKLVYDVAKELSKHHKITVLTSDSYDESQRMPEKYKIQNTNNFSVNYFPNISNKWAYKYNIYFSWKFFIKSVVRVHETDVVHIHDFYTLHNVWVAILSIIFKKPYIVSVHGCLEKKRVLEKSFFKKIFIKMFGNWMLKNSATNIASSLSEIQSYSDNNIKKNKIYFLPNGVNLDEAKIKPDKESFKKINNIPKNKIIFTYLGRIHKIKGLDLLVDAITKNSFKNCHFIIAGSDDGYLDELKNIIKENKIGKKTTLMGAIFGKQKYELFNASDVFIYPSYSEGFSIGILEAAGFGLPLIITKGCNFDQVSKNGAGIVVKHTSLDLQKAIKKMTDKNNRKKFSKNAKQLIAKDYSIQAMSKKLEKVYTEVI